MDYNEEPNTGYDSFEYECDSFDFQVNKVPFDIERGIRFIWSFENLLTRAVWLFLFMKVIHLLRIRYT